MDRRVIWTEPALDDLDAVAEFIARDSPGYAAAFVRRVREAARSLSRMSERGRKVPEVPDPQVRELLVGRYRVIYEIAGSSVYVLACIHGVRFGGALARREPVRTAGGRLKQMMRTIRLKQGKAHG